ncbi:TRAP transporter small permease subunit [Alisedimentitalea sp. MJ-SS2]|uniref:TRAP transporter small permease n=1 Tax=Aliisedimentitalea sp. MJ-SS2 TaxID=3049795 RepID=UPI00290DFDF2|nr:TRAP transporter small permease subunit [Alisedimentitalea sp. MJ-SS2]MDU8925876.1 TRAP transporter small permease subunit [Alisedimentitalea sp. MJ-SS2]
MQLQRIMMSLARFMAILGGLVLTCLILLTCISVLGRGINTFLHSGMMQNTMPGLADTLLGTGVGPVLGDYELVEAGIAFSIFAFLPFCQITAGHATVDIFTSRLSVKVNRFIQMVVEIVFAVVLIVIAMRLYEGMMAKMGLKDTPAILKLFGDKGGLFMSETSQLLQFPLWWAYGLSLIAAIVAATVGVYMAFVRIGEFFSNRTVVESAGVDH